MKRWLRNRWENVVELWPIGIMMLVMIGAAGGCVFWIAYGLHYRDKWAKDAQVAKCLAEREVEKQKRLTDVQEFADGKRSLASLDLKTQDMIKEAEYRAHPYWRDDRPEWRKERDIYPELYEIVPGLAAPGLSFKDAPLPTIEEYQRRKAAFFDRHKTIYTQKRSYEEVSYEEYLRIDHKELLWLDTMGHRLNDAVVAKAKQAATGVTMVKDAVMALRLVNVFGSGQHGYAANVKGFNPNESHKPFSDKVLDVLVAGGHDYFVPNGMYGNGIITSPGEKPDKDGVTLWCATYNARELSRHLSYQACSLEPTVLTDLTGRVVAIQVGKEALRVTFYDKKTQPCEKLTPAILKLAELLGVKGKIGAHWSRIDDTTTWELKLGA
jgi:hypothetical protein